MGTLAEVQIWAADPDQAGAIADSMFAVCDRIDSLLSTWNGNSALSRLNRAPAGTWGELGIEGAAVVAAALEVAARSGGAFDPTVLPLVRLWGFRGAAVSAPPDSAALDRTVRLVNHAAVTVDTVRGRVRLERPGMALDLGGIAKGYAIDRALAAARQAGATGVTFDLGGNLAVSGEGPARAVGVIDPAVPDQLALTVSMSGGAVATSGQYERFTLIGGRRYGHLIDPRSGRPVPFGTSFTVVTGSALWADALATAATVLGPVEGLALVEDWPGAEGVVISGGVVRTTSGLVSVDGADQPD